MTKRILAAAAVAVVLCTLWTALVVAWALRGVLTPIAARGDPRAFMAAAEERVKDAGIGNCALGLIDDGRIFGSYFYSVGAPIDDGTLFQMASVSKWVTAWGVMALVQQGRLDLDAPISRYLTRWQLPPSSFNNADVTVRRLLSHTAGLTDGLGYGGFPTGTPAQSLEESLTYAVDHVADVDGRVRVGRAPGTGFQYSGGGYALLQLIIEEVTHDRFEHFMQQTVLAPLGMVRSTYDEDLAMTRGIATSYDGTALAMHYHFSAPAAASLYSDVADLARFVMAHVPGEDGAPPGRGILSPELLAAMRAPAARAFGIGFWGLGMELYGRSGPSDRVFGHIGVNLPAINHAVRIDPPARSGIVVLSSGSSEFATRLAGDWELWKSGNINGADVSDRLGRRVGTIAVGAAVIVALIAAWLIRDARSRRRQIA